MKNKTFKYFLVLCLLLLTHCTSLKDRVLDTGDQTQLQKRSYQSRMFETNDRQKILRAVIATMQDLGFIIDRADSSLGTISGTKLDNYSVKMTVTASMREQSQVLVRASASFNTVPINEPEAYQDFFVALGKSVFLQANEIE